MVQIGSILTSLTHAGKKLVMGAAALALVALLAFMVFSDRPLGPWQSSGMPDLAATGELPQLSIAMDADPALEERVRALANRDEGWLFANFRDVDIEIVSILLMWSQADMSSAAKTREGLDSRIDTFLRKIYGFGPDDYILGDPLVGTDPWVRWFNHYKPRLLIQTAAQRVYDRGVVYDPVEDRMLITGDLSQWFLKDFRVFLEQQPDPAPFLNNFLAFVNATKGLQNLSEEDREIVQELMALRPKP